MLNRADAKVGLTQSEFEDTLGLKADSVLVSSREVLAAVNRGEPLVSAFPANANTKALTAFADSLTQGGTTNRTAEGGRKASRLRLRKG